ncbi:murein-DD-endopeptidase [Sulfuriferula multivorans]|uniref:Murein-DD-endopeptidase n=2 Tax=Sulfuriferula multivorans TaxID=1559896 RepID=A0A401JC69_9PROT|nr:murein-DD-endopeptidase [Sulfuriferula multivorans]
MNAKLFTLLVASLTTISVAHADPRSTRTHHSNSAENNIEAVSSLQLNEPQLNSLSVLVLNQDNGQALYQKNIDTQTPIASITKLMTAMVILDAHQPMDEDITISPLDVDYLRHSSSRLAVGTTLSRGELLHLALIASENRAAYALARNYPGGLRLFINAMNNKARALNMQHTTFEDPTGLSSNNRSTAEDLAKMVEAATHYPQIRDITTTGSYEITRPALVRVGHRHKKEWRHIVKRVEFHNTNRLVRNENWSIGLSKTGFINEAGHCLVMQAKIARKEVIIVLLDGGKYARVADAERIKAWLEHLAPTTVALKLDGRFQRHSSSAYAKN